MDTSKEFEDWAESVIDNIAVEAGLDGRMFDEYVQTIERVIPDDIPGKYVRLRRIGGGVMKIVVFLGQPWAAQYLILAPDEDVENPHSV